jgi:hypothetical protein
MFRVIRHNRTIFHAGLLLAVLGAWLPFDCRDCLAYSVSNTDVEQQSHIDHCSKVNDQADTTTESVDVNSPDECDCGDINALVSTKQESTVNYLKHSVEKPSFDYFTSNEPAPILLTGSVIKSFKSDRACHHPHERYCIQLK